PSDTICFHSELLFHFCFQARVGIRDRNVTGVQTCALPISQQPDEVGLQSTKDWSPTSSGCWAPKYRTKKMALTRLASRLSPSSRSEERRVGKEKTLRWGRTRGVLEYTQK